MSAGITIKNLRALYWLARLGNFHLVARQLHTTQPAISARISKLEEQLGARLFSRGHGAVQLTPEGHEALRLGEAVLDAVDSLNAQFIGIGEPSGIVRIGLIDTIARTWLPALLERIQREYRKIDLNITTEGTTSLHSLLEDGTLHIAVTINRYDNRDFSSIELCKYDMAWVASPDIIDPARVYTPEELLELPLVGYEKSSPPDRLLDGYFGDLSPRRVVHNTTNSMSTMIWLAENRLGIAAIPPRAIRQYLDDGRLTVVKTVKAFDPITFYLNYRIRPYSLVVESTTALMIDVVEEFFSEANE